MPEIGWAGLGIVPEVDSGFGRKLGRDIDPALSRVGRDSGKRFGGIMGKAAVATAAGLFGAGFAAFQLGKDALGEAREAQKVGRTSAAILKATGNAANLSRKEYDKLTESLMRKTAIDDEQIAQGGNLLLTFKNVKREGKGLNDVFGRTLSSALDLSAAGFGSIDGAAKMLGKALNDPVKGVSALGRAGVTFSEDQKKAIKSMVASNDLLGAQKLILREVESQVGGTAEKQKTSAKELETAWGNVKEEIGFALIPVMEDLADVLLDKGIPAAEKFGDWLSDDGLPAVKDFAEQVKPLAKELLPAAASAFDTIKGAGEKVLPVVKGIVDAFNDMPDWAKDATVLGAVGLGVGAKFNKGKGGAAGGLLGGGGSGSSLANPAYVWVVNGSGTGAPGGGGGKPKPGGGKTPGFIGFNPATALAIGEVVAGKTQLESTFDFFNEIDTTSLDKLKDSLDGSLGKYADDLGIDIGRLAEDLQRFGSKGEYVQEVLDDLEKGSNPGFFKDYLDGVNPFSNKVADLGTALDKLEGSFARIDQGIKDRKELGRTLSGTPDGAGESIDVTKLFSKIPDAKLKVLQDPTTIKTREDVRDLLENVDGLTRNDYKVLFSILGLSKAKDDAAVLLKHMRELTGMTIPVGNGTSGSGLNPFASRQRGSNLPGGVTIDRLVVQGSDTDRLIAQLRDIQRRQGIGGTP